MSTTNTKDAPDKKDILTLIREANERAEKKKKDAEEERLRDVSKFLNAAKLEIANALNTAATIYEGIPAEARYGIMSDPSLSDMLKALGLRVTKGSRRGAGTKSGRNAGTGGQRAKKVSDSDFLSYLSVEHSTKDIKEKWNLKNPSARLTKMVKDKKVTTREENGESLWKAC